MSFRVEPDQIIQFQHQLHKVTDGCPRAVEYAEHVSADPGVLVNPRLPASDSPNGALIIRVLNATSRARPSVVGLFTRLGEICAASEAELVRSAAYYSDTDAANAADVDARYPR